MSKTQINLREINTTAPCSPTCFNHVTHPCEKCGRLRGVLKPSWRQLEAELADARAEIERLRGELIRNIQPEPTLLCGGYALTMDNSNDSEKSDVERKDALIEQMREALTLLLEGATHDFHYVCQHRDNCLCWGCQKKRVKAALLAAERGGK